MVRIPRTHEWGWTVSAGTEALANHFYARDPKAFDDYAQHAYKSAIPTQVHHGVPVPDVAAVTPIIEVFANYDLFRQRPIVSRGLEGLEPRDQATPWNAPFAKAVGDYLNVSPAQLEHLLQAYTGGGYRRIENIAQLAQGQAVEAPDIPVIGRLALRREYERFTDEFHDRLDRLSRQRASAKLHQRDTTAFDAEFYRLSAYENLMSALRKHQKPLTGRSERFEIGQYLTGLAIAGLRAEELKHYPNPLHADQKQLPEAVQSEVNQWLAIRAEHLSDPPPSRHANETLAKFQERRDGYQRKIDSAKTILTEAGRSPAELSQLLRRHYISRGQNVSNERIMLLKARLQAGQPKPAVINP